MIAPFKALIWLYNNYLTNYKKSQKPKSDIFWSTLTSNKKTPVFKKSHNRIIYPSTFASSFNQISRVGSPILDFIKII